jgi:hypothetical protein
MIGSPAADSLGYPPLGPANAQEAKPPAQSPPSSGNASSQAIPRPHHRKHTQTPGAGTKKVVREGGTTEAESQITPSMTLEEASHQRQTTAQLLASTDLNLHKLSSRQLDLSQQATLGQINTFMQQAKKAVNTGDVQRGHNLALKALLLSDDLVKH